MIKKGSRYEYATIEYYRDKFSNDLYPVLWYSFDDIGTLTYREHLWQEGDRIDRVASKYYDSPGFWWIILEHNPEIEDPPNIPAGYVLRIPNRV